MIKLFGLAAIIKTAKWPSIETRHRKPTKEVDVDRAAHASAQNKARLWMEWMKKPSILDKSSREEHSSATAFIDWDVP